VECNDGLFGSTTVVMTIRRFEVDKPQTCVTTTKDPYFKLTSDVTRHVYYRNP
jgi:hypothetical protein